MKKLLATLLCAMLLALPVFATQQSVQVTLTITVVGAIQYTVVSPLPSIVVNQAYSNAIINISGGTAPYTCAEDASLPLPTGLTIAASGSTCVLSGTLTSLPSGGQVNLKVNITDSTH